MLWSVDKFTWQFGGFMAGSVVIYSSLANFLGAAKVDSNTAEMSAFTWAFTLALQYDAVASVDIYFDSMFAAKKRRSNVE